MEKQKLRMIHNMARSGSTLICKCLGCMDNVILLSELHPMDGIFNLLRQAEKWFGLLTPDEAAELQKGGVTNYVNAVILIERRCRERGASLVLRDWAHFDYTGFPFTSTPSYYPQLYAQLTEHFDIVRMSVARDPVTQWQSLSQLDAMREPLQSGKFGPDQFLLGYRKYAELCVETGFIRYEDFLRKPELPMRKLCEQLQIKFDPNFIKKWADYRTITGDVPKPESPNEPNKIKKLYNSKKIVPIRKQPVEPGLRSKFLANADYHRACKLLGYNPLAK